MTVIEWVQVIARTSLKWEKPTALSVSENFIHGQQLHVIAVNKVVY